MRRTYGFDRPLLVQYLEWLGRTLTGDIGQSVYFKTDVVGLVLVWVLVFGPVLALALSFAAFVLLWLGDRPLRAGVRAERFVRVEELRVPEPDDPDDPDDVESSGEEPGDEDSTTPPNASV